MKFRSGKERKVPLTSFGGKVLGLVFALSFLFTFPASAEIEESGAGLIQGPVSMEVQYGYGNTAKGGRYVPVTVSVSNTTEEMFQGTVTVSTMEFDYQVYSYEYPVEAESQGVGKRSMLVPFGNGSDQVFVALTDQSGRQVAKKRLKLDINREVPELFIGVLSDTPERIDYMDGVGISYSALKTKLIPITKEEVPEETVGLSLMDVILVTNYRLRDLSEKQTKAIMDWVKGGGILILGTGNRVDDTLGRFAPELLDDNYDMPSQMDIRLGEEGEGQPILIPDIACVDIPLHGADILDSDSGFPLFQAAAMEKGMIAVAAYDFADISDFAGEDPMYVDNLFTRLLGEERIHSLDDYFYGGGSDEYWDVQTVINSGNVTRLPKVSVYFAVIFLYIILAGPGMWLFLRRHEIQGYYWGAVTMLSMIFVAVIYLLGLGTRFRSTFLTYATIQDVSEESVIETSYVNIRNPYNKPYSLELASDYSIRPVSRNAFYSYSYGNADNPKFTETSSAKMTIIHGTDGTKLDFHETSAFESNYMELKKTSDNYDNSGITGEIRYFDGKVTGTVTNQHDFVLEDSAVLMYGLLIPLGDLQPGETKILDFLTVFQTPIGREDFVAARVTGLDTYEQADIGNKDYVRSMERANLLSFYMRSELEGYRREARIVGFAKKLDEQFLGDRKTETYGLDMFTSSLPVSNQTEDGEICRTALMKAPDAQKGSYDYASNSMYGSDSVTLEYAFGNDIDVEEITFSRVSQELLENQLLGRIYSFDGDMYFYNYNTGNYDKMKKDRDVFSVDALSPYLSPGNTLTIRYIDSSREEAGWDKILPMLTVKGREK